MLPRVAVGHMRLAAGAGRSTASDPLGDGGDLGRGMLRLWHQARPEAEAGTIGMMSACLLPQDLANYRRTLSIMVFGNDAATRTGGHVPGATAGRGLDCPNRWSRSYPKVGYSLGMSQQSSCAT